MDVRIEVRCRAIAEYLDEDFHWEARYESTFVHSLAKLQNQGFGVRKLTIQRAVYLRVLDVGCVGLNSDILPKHILRPSSCDRVNK